MNGYDWNNLDDNRNHARRKAGHDEQQFSKDSLVSAMENFVRTVNIMNETILVPCRLMDRQIGDDLDKFQSSSVDFDSNSDKSISKLNDKNGTEVKNIHETLKSADLFNLFNILNATKNNLLWTGNETVANFIRSDVQSSENSEKSTNSIIANLENAQTQDIKVENNTFTETNIKGHQRRPSTASLSSIASISDLTSDFSGENDSGVESESQSGGGGGAALKNNNNRIKGAYSGKSDKASELAKLCKFHLFGLYQCLEQMSEAANYLTTRYQNDVGSV